MAAARHLDPPARLARCHPSPVAANCRRPKPAPRPWPARAASLAQWQSRVALVVPALPLVAHGKAHAQTAQAHQPSAQQRCRLHIGRKHPARAANKSGDAQNPVPKPAKRSAQSLAATAQARRWRSHTGRQIGQSLLSASGSFHLTGEQNLRPAVALPSRTSTCRPCSANRCAAIRPAGPAPTMATSHDNVGKTVVIPQTHFKEAANSKKGAQHSASGKPQRRPCFCDSTATCVRGHAQRQPAD